jgi:hypothetical protein
MDCCCVAVTVRLSVCLQTRVRSLIVTDTLIENRLDTLIEDRLDTLLENRLEFSRGLQSKLQSCQLSEVDPLSAEIVPARLLRHWRSWELPLAQYVKHMSQPEPAVQQPLQLLFALGGKAFCQKSQTNVLGLHLATNFFLWFNWGSAIVLADHTRFSWANTTAGSLRHCLTSKTRHAPNTRRCPAPGPKTARELNPHTWPPMTLMG